MKRCAIRVIMCLVLLFGLAFTVSADSAASNIQIYASVNTDGDAEVTMTVRIRLETAVDSLSFPLPPGATDITMNDSSVNATRTSTAILVDLGSAIRGYTGDYSVTFQYKIPDVVGMVDGRMTLEFPLLRGFIYPVESMNFTIMLPGGIENRPVFQSTYHQDSIESILETSVNNNIVTGILSYQLKDQESLSMTLQVPQSMFGGVSTYVRVGNPEIVPMAVCAALAVLYWLLFLRTFPLLKVRSATPPEGVTAGELGSRLTLGGADLTMMVFTWAQLGYIMIHLDDNGRVVLHKRMDMGNERSSFEVKTFRTLFGKHRSVDGTGYQYARLAQKVARTVPGAKTVCDPKNGSTRIFRMLSCGVQVFSGICFAMNITGVTALQAILAIALAFLGAVSAWAIQGGVYRLHLRYKLPLILSLVLSVAWVLVGVWAGQWAVGLCSVLAQLLTGLAAAYGGRRTELGRQNGCQILGLRDYLKTVSREDIQRIQANDPEYFYNMVPYAMVLGVDKAFARQFGRKKLPQCPYFACGVHSRMTAEDWAGFLREAADILDSAYRRMEWEKFAVVHFGR